MKRSRKVASIAAATIVAMAVVYFLTRGNHEELTDWEQLRFETLAQDREALANPNASESALIGALQRLAPLKDEQVLRGLPVWAKSSSANVRAQSALATSFVPDETAIPLLKSLLKDRVPEVRASAINALGAQPTQARRALLADLWKNRNSLSDSENLQLAVRLFEISSTEERPTYEKALLDLVVSGRQTASRLQAAVRLLNLDPNNTKLRQVLRNFVLARAEDPELAGQSLRLLLPLQNEELATSSFVGRIASDSSDVFRAYVAQALAASCIANTDAIYVKVLTDKSSAVRATAQRSLLEMSSPRALRILDKARESAPQFKEPLEKIEEEVKNFQRNGRDCAP